MNTTDDINELDSSNAATDVLQEVLITISITMNKLFPIKQTNELFCKFLLIKVKPPDVLLRHIMDGTLNSKLKANN